MDHGEETFHIILNFCSQKEHSRIEKQVESWIQVEREEQSRKSRQISRVYIVKFRKQERIHNIQKAYQQERNDAVQDSLFPSREAIVSDKSHNEGDK